jgi:hypothetical protein
MRGKLFLYSQLFGTMALKEQRKKNGVGTSPTDFLGCPYAFLNLERVHDEATTSDDGGDTGNQFNIVARADEHGKKANDD